MKIFDTHAHYADARFDDDRDEVITGIKKAGAALVTEVICDLRDTQKGFDIIEKYSFVRGAVGMHPHYAISMDNAMMDALRGYLSRPKIVALGEIGLDYYYDMSPRDVQREVFDKQLSLAAELKKPVVLHVRDAIGEALDILRAHKSELVSNGGIMHCYSGSAESARDFLDLGLYIGFGGSLTFKNNKRGVETAAFVPLDRFVFETDCPYLAPIPHRGERNDSRFITLVAEKFAEIKGVSPDEAANMAFGNGLNAYRME